MKSSLTQMLPYLPFIVLGAATIVAACHITFYW